MNALQHEITLSKIPETENLIFKNVAFLISAEVINPPVIVSSYS